MTTTKQRLREAVDELYKDPSSARALAEVFVLLEQAKDDPVAGVSDGSVGRALWERRLRLALAFETIQEERQTLDETEDA